MSTTELPPTPGPSPRLDPETITGAVDVLLEELGSVRDAAAAAEVLDRVHRSLAASLAGIDRA